MSRRIECVCGRTAFAVDDEPDKFVCLSGHLVDTSNYPPVTSVELVAAARWLLLLRDDPALSGTIYRGALGMWTELTSAPNDTTAVEWAETIAALDTLPAHVTPY